VPISVSQRVRVHVLGLGCVHSTPWGVTIPENAARWEANHAYNEQLLVRRQRRRAWIATWMAMRDRGEDTPFEPESSGEDNKEENGDGEEGEVNPAPHSPPREALPLLGDIFSR
jgi:hypothetical protein